MPQVQHIETYDTTLRDGEQGLGITLSLEDKLRIVERLDHFGIDIIEGGYPTSNPKDIEFFKRVGQLQLKHARIAAFGSTCHKGTLPQADPFRPLKRNQCSVRTAEAPGSRGPCRPQIRVLLRPSRSFGFSPDAFWGRNVTGARPKSPARRKSQIK